jgi:hypothetical protein
VEGFDKGTSGSVVATDKGKNNLKHRADVAVALFIDNVAGALWMLDGIKAIGSCLQGISESIESLEHQAKLRW